MTVVIPAGVVTHGPAGPTPTRRPGSVRRTATLEATWPEGGAGTPMHVLGRARDLFTPRDGADPQLLGEAEIRAVIAADRASVQLTAVPADARVAALQDMRSGWRRRLAQALASDAESGSLAYYLLDDLSGVAFVSFYALENWGDSSFRGEPTVAEGRDRRLHMVDICAGWQAGSSAYGTESSPGAIPHSKPVPDLRIPEDPWAWHSLEEVHAAAARRARRVDVWREGDALLVDAHFQDAGTTPDGGRIAAHEYTFTASIDAESGRITDITAVPQVLPFDECPLAAGNAPALIGASVRDLRTVVNERLPGIEGCTHMNDALRALAEVPILALALG